MIAIEDFLMRIYFSRYQEQSRKYVIGYWAAILIGAIAVLNSKPTRSTHVDLQPYHTQTLQFHFYFPSTGKFPHFPVHVSKNEKSAILRNPQQFPAHGNIFGFA